MNTEALEALKDDPFWQAWAKYLNHVQPLDAPMCPECSAAKKPGDGCQEGRDLYNEYRLVRISRNVRVPQ